jgi:hypothetical protein
MTKILRQCVFFFAVPHLPRAALVPRFHTPSCACRLGLRLAPCPSCSLAAEQWSTPPAPALLRFTDLTKLFLVAALAGVAAACVCAPLPCVLPGLRPACACIRTSGGYRICDSLRAPCQSADAASNDPPPGTRSRLVMDDHDDDQLSVSQPRTVALTADQVPLPGRSSVVAAGGALDW